MKQILLKGSRLVVSFIRIVLLSYAALIAISFATKFIDNPKQYQLLMKVSNSVDNFNQPIVSTLKQLIPYKFHGVDYSSIILIICVLIIVSIMSSIRDKIYRKLHKDQYNEWRRQISQKASEEQLNELDTKYQELQQTEVKASDRKKLLQEFVLLKTKLDDMGQQLAFLAIDVVDSTGMKKDEDKHLVSYDFDRYNEIVIDCLKKYGVVKYAMTPDGIMSCFRTVDDAVNAATTLLVRLSSFNQSEKKIKRTFSIRAGINAGFVYLDNETPLEQISDRVIDIAGHMQKHAKPDTINIAAAAIEPLKNRAGFKETVDVIDEQRVYQWSK